MGKKGKGTPGTKVLPRVKDAAGRPLALPDGAGLTTDPPPPKATEGEPAEDPREGLGYVPRPPPHLTPEREKALFDTESELCVARSDLVLATEDHAARLEACKDAKKKRDGKAALVQSLLERLADIVGARPYEQELKGMGPGSGPKPRAGTRTKGTKRTQGTKGAGP